MRVPWSWLREYVPDAPAATADLLEQLSISGTKVEGLHAFGVPGATNGGSEGFRVGRVLSFMPHPNADKLRLCRVDVGEDEPRQIVCGASNFDEGDTVAVVLPGATMPGGMQIREAKLRGEDSRGMMLSERELELSQDHAGIMILPDGWAPGEPLSQHIQLGDDVVELEITPNRPDCLGMFGVAREVAAITGATLVAPAAGPVEATGNGSVEDVVRVRNEAPDLCPVYAARAFTDVKVGPSPYWMRARLSAAGMRPINNVVDITNYVMLTFGQPLHAFDAAKIRGGEIIVRRASGQEMVTTLDGVERALEPWMLSIADAQGTAVIAGVMGAADVEVDASTTSIVLEAACFDGPTIQRTSMRLGLRSESSARFEKGLDPYLPHVAMEYASRLIVELCGARMLAGTQVAETPDGVPTPPHILLERGMASRVLGIDIAEQEVERILTALGYEVSREGDTPWDVAVPHWRMFDTTRPIDLVEEIARVHGLDRIPARLPARAAAIGGLGSSQRLQRDLEDAAATLGLHETVTYSLVAAGDNVRLGLDHAEVLKLSNPMTSDHVELRGSLVGSMLDVVRHNRAGGSDDVALFEVARTFAPAAAGEVGADGLPVLARERRVLALALAGNLHGGGIDAAPIPADFSSAAGIVDSLLDAVGVVASRRAMANVAPMLHPGQAADVMVGDAHVGWVATVHPALVRDSGIRGAVVAAELDLDVLAGVLPGIHAFRAVSSFPPVLQDLAVVVADDVAAGDVIDTVRSAGGDLLETAHVFDRYVGGQVEMGYHSLALRLCFRAADRTLTDDEVAAIRDLIVGELAACHGARLRD